MPQKLWEILLTVINDKPHQFAVREFNIDDSDIGFDRDISAGYIFEGTGQSNPKENIRFVVYVKTELTDLYFDGTPKELHNEVIAFALYSIRKEPTRKEFTFTAALCANISETKSAVL